MNRFSIPGGVRRDDAGAVCRRDPMLAQDPVEPGQRILSLLEGKPLAAMDAVIVQASLDNAHRRPVLEQSPDHFEIINSRKIPEVLGRSSDFLQLALAKEKEVAEGTRLSVEAWGSLEGEVPPP